MKIDDEFLKKILRLTGKDNKQIVANGHYICSFLKKEDMTQIDPNCCVFSENWKESCFPTMTQYAEVFVYDTSYGKGHHDAGFGKLYHMHHIDTKTHSFFLMLHDNTLVEVLDIKLEDDIFQFRKFIVDNMKLSEDNATKFADYTNRALTKERQWKDKKND